VRGQRHAPTATYPGKDPVPIVQEAGWVSRRVWTGAENLAPTGIRPPDRPARRQSLPGPHICQYNFKKMIVCFKIYPAK